MSATDSVLASIDDTLAGYDGAVSAAGGDMMRWSPQRVICDGGKPLSIKPKPAVTITGIVRVRGVPEPDLAQMARQVAALYDACLRAVMPMAQAYQAFGAAAAKIVHPLLAVAEPGHRQRCRTCNPAGNPLPLPGGHEYNRRRRARQRRRARR